MLAETVFDQLLTDAGIADHWYVGFSGGVDSTVLLHSLVLWRERHSAAPPISAIHVNHQLSPQADQWQQHCQQVCATLGVALHCETVDVARYGAGEGAARAARYQVFEAMVAERQALLLAHHLDDQVETFFLRLLRGAGIDGLAGMPVSRPIGQGRLVRPLITFTRDDIERVAVRSGLAFVEDPTNATTDIDRNLLRHEVLPLLARRWPAYRSTVSRAAGHMAEAARARDGALTVPVIHSITGDAGLPLQALTGKASSEAASSLRYWLRQQGLQAPDQASLHEFLRQLTDSAEAAAPELKTMDYALARFGEGVYLRPQFIASPPAAAPIQLDQPLLIPGVGRITFVVAEGGLNLAAIQRLEVRFRQGGETCRPEGRGGATTLKKIYQECAVPRWWRDRVPLLYGDDELLAVAGFVQCEPSGSRASGATGEPLWRMVWDPAAA